MASIYITGGAGFIGFHLQKHLKGKYDITALDILKADNKAALMRAAESGNVLKGNIQENFLDNIHQKPEVVIHLAAETGIPGSLSNPAKYFEANVQGTFNVLEQCRKNNVKYLIYTSSSSVYEEAQAVMFENTGTTHQLSFYGTTKKMCEMMVANYCRQFSITAIGLRLFTVYGSWTRPDMAAYKFMNAIENELPITLYNQGNVFRDFTHVSDVVNSIELLIEKIQQEKYGIHQIFNIGCGSPVSVKNYAAVIAENLGKPLRFNSAELPPNELIATHADSSALCAYTGYQPSCAIEIGIKEMTDWFKKVKYE